MQNMFRMIGYGENLGSGFPLILNAWNEKHWIKPELLEQPEDLANKLGISLATLKRELTSLRKEGYITRSGSDKNGQWIVVSK